MSFDIVMALHSARAEATTQRGGRQAEEQEQSMILSGQHVLLLSAVEGSILQKETQKEPSGHAVLPSLY